MIVKATCPSEMYVELQWATGRYILEGSSAYTYLSNDLKSNEEIDRLSEPCPGSGYY
jgi:hypothetical protein